MELAMIGLGRMGANMAERLVRGGHTVRGYDPGEAARQQAEARGIVPHANLQNAVAALPAPRVVWLMVPAGQVVDDTIAQLRPLLATGDTVIDGGNSNYKDTQRRGAQLAHEGIAADALRHRHHRVAHLALHPALMHQLRQQPAGDAGKASGFGQHQAGLAHGPPLRRIGACAGIQQGQPRHALRCLAQDLERHIPAHRQPGQREHRGRSFQHTRGHAGHAVVQGQVGVMNPCQVGQCGRGVAPQARIAQQAGQQDQGKGSHPHSVGAAPPADRRPPPTVRSTSATHAAA